MGDMGLSSHTYIHRDATQLHALSAKIAPLAATRVSSEVEAIPRMINEAMSSIPKIVDRIETELCDVNICYVLQDAG